MVDAVSRLCGGVGVAEQGAGEKGKRMTRDEILNMPAGREINRLVAKEVMKWSHDPEVPYYDVVKEDGTIEHVTIRWAPSEDIYAAWEVVEHFGTFSLARAWKLDDKEWRGYSCWLGVGPEGYSALAETAPLAICRAALLVVMK